MFEEIKIRVPLLEEKEVQEKSVFESDRNIRNNCFCDKGMCVN